MTSKECKIFCIYGHECDVNNGTCPADIEIEVHKEMEKNNQTTFGSWSENLRLRFVHEYRKLETISYTLADNEDSPFDALLNVLISYFPAYEWTQIHNEDNEINDTYYELVEMSRNEDVTDKEFLERVIRRNF